MSPIPWSACTIVHGRRDHLHRMMAALARCKTPPAELVIVWMNEAVDPPLPEVPFPVRTAHVDDATGLPLAAARNRAALLAHHDWLIFLDVDCIVGPWGPMQLLADGMTWPGLHVGDVRYLPRNACARGLPTELELDALGMSPPLRRSCLCNEPALDPRDFSSTFFATHRDTFTELGGFDPAFVGYGGEDTELAVRAAARGVQVRLSPARAYHQFHPLDDPPHEHLHHIVRNANRFHQLWGSWIMTRWLADFRDQGLIRWSEEADAAVLLAPVEEAQPQLVLS